MMPEGPTTEPQRQALDAMSAELVRKLNTMIAEQEQRVQLFAAQHPNTPLPPTVASPAAVPPAERVAPRPLPKLEPGSRPAPAAVTPPGHRPSSSPAVPLPPVPGASSSPAAEPDDERDDASDIAGNAADANANEPAPSADKKNAIGIGPIIFLLVAVFFLFRSCN